MVIPVRLVEWLQSTPAAIKTIQRITRCRGPKFNDCPPAFPIKTAAGFCLAAVSALSLRGRFFYRVNKCLPGKQMFTG
ncbi:hypothetical protein CYR55_00615 [Chimaeribacter californicus]|uniref:Uncharacterized protein n=1 Tax=Chimaeribacter californicus TaxID=2060067 RepID=A0A2N5EFT7_9GAMM|nr:hypothetical protein CYR55_00615 [Chimaeribacter californicus]